MTLPVRPGIDPAAHIIAFRQLPLRDVAVGPLKDLGPAGQSCEVVGLVGSQQIRLELLLNRATSSGTLYFAEPAEPPCVWLGRVFAGRA